MKKKDLYLVFESISAVNIKYTAVWTDTVLQDCDFHISPLKVLSLPWS